MKPLLITIILFFSMNCFSQTSRKFRTLPFSTKMKTYTNVKLGISSSHIRYKTSNSDIDNPNQWVGITFDKPFSYNNSIEFGVLFCYFESNHFLELPVLYKFFISRKTNLSAGVSPNILVDALSPLPLENYSKTNVFGFSGLIGIQHYYSKKWFLELYYSRGFKTQFEQEDLNLINGVRDTYRIGIGYVIF